MSNLELVMPLSIGVFAILVVAHWLSYSYLKNRVLKSQIWGLNICSGKTDGGGVNADISRHASVPNFLLLKEVYHLPFRDREFETVLCSHTIEHVEDPKAMYRELRRVGKSVTLLVPPLWDLGAVLNIFEHKSIFLTFVTKHKVLPPFINFRGARTLHKLFGQINHA